MATFQPIRNTKAVIDNTPIVDGQFLVTTDLGVDNKIYADVGSTRIQLGGDSSSFDLSVSSTNLGTITRHICYKKNGICEYKLVAKCGTWIAGVGYAIGILDSSFRPIETFAKEERLNDQFFGFMTISAVSGIITITPRVTISNSTISIDEIFISA